MAGVYTTGCTLPGYTCCTTRVMTVLADQLTCSTERGPPAREGLVLHGPPLTSDNCPRSSDGPRLGLASTLSILTSRTSTKGNPLI